MIMIELARGPSSMIVEADRGAVREVFLLRIAQLEKMPLRVKRA
jgi:hypothetical protein